MLPQPEPGRAKAALHYRRAGEYHELAQTLIARPPINAGATDILLVAAGALLYEAAKQSVNAVANLNGRDPRANHEKMAALRTIANAHPYYPDLLDDSREAWHPHLHADQFNLTPDELVSALERTRRFIADLQSIHRPHLLNASALPGPGEPNPSPGQMHLRAARRPPSFVLSSL